MLRSTGTIRRTINLALLGAALFIVIASPVFAASTKTPAPAGAPVPATAATATAPKELTTPDPAANPALQLIMRAGAKLYYLGNQSGLNGWLILKDGKIQFAYAAPDGQHALVGGLFGPHGEDVTAVEADAVMAANPEIRLAMTSSVHETTTSGKTELISEMESAANGDFLNPSTPKVTISPGERLYQDMVAAKGVTVGKKDPAPTLFMVIDPDCPHCQATWRAIRSYVFGNRLQIHLIPIANENSDSERAAAQLLRVADPLDAWNKYVDGDKAPLAGAADKNLIESVQSNHLVIDDWDLESTPILVYRGKNGKIKIEQGEPDKIDAIVDDIAIPSSP